MSYLVVIGTSPWTDTSVVVGPFLSATAARKADEDMTALGYNTEVATCHHVVDLDPLEGAPSEEGD